MTDPHLPTSQRLSLFESLYGDHKSNQPILLAFEASIEQWPENHVCAHGRYAGDALLEEVRWRMQKAREWWARTIIVEYPQHLCVCCQNPTMHKGREYYKTVKMKDLPENISRYCEKCDPNTCSK